MSDAATRSEGAAEPRLELRRRFAAPREAVFRAWTEPAAMAEWWGPEGCTAPLCELDLRPGGSWRTCIRTSDGKDLFVGGRYREISPPARLVFTLAWETDGVAGHETVVTLEFLDRGRATELVLTQAPFETTEARDSHGDGWSSSFDCLERHLLGR